MADSSVIKEFLYAIGFKVDDASVASFRASAAKSESAINEASQANAKKSEKAATERTARAERVAKATAERKARDDKKRVDKAAKEEKDRAEATKQQLGAMFGELGAAVAAAGFVEAFQKITDSLSDLYWQSILVKSSAQNIQAFRYGLSQVGGTAEGASAAVEGLSDALASSPGTEGLLHSLGVGTRDKNRNLRDTVDLLHDAAKALKGMPEYKALQFSQMLGIGDRRTLEALMRDTGKFEDQQKAFYRSIGLDVDKATESANRFKTTESELFADLGALTEKVGGDFLGWLNDVGTKYNGQFVQIAGDARGLGDALSALGKDINIGPALDAIFKTVLSFADAILKEITDIVRAMDDVAHGRWKQAGQDALKALTDSPGGALVKAGVRIVQGRDPFSETASAPSGATGGAKSRASPKSIVSILQSLGVSSPAAQGIAAGIVAESTGDPTARPRDKHGNLLSSAYGLGQWLKDRQAEFKKWSGKDIVGSSIVDQLKFMLFELMSGKEQRAGRDILGAGSAAGALQAYVNEYMRPGAVGALGDVARGSSVLASLSPGAAVLSTRSAGAANPNSAQINQKTDINVYGSGDAHATAAQVSGAQGRVNGQLLRNLNTALA